MPRDARLSVVIDGTPLADDEARALWDRFSLHMDAKPGDLAGFATAEGFASVHPTAEAGRAVLRISRTAPQRPYGSSSAGPKLEPSGSTGGSSLNQGTQGKRNKRRGSS
jgi:hypothetical protein